MSELSTLDSLLAYRKNTFTETIINPNYQKLSLNLPIPALYHLLVSPQLYSLVQNPININLSFERRSETYLSAFVKAHKVDEENLAEIILHNQTKNPEMPVLKVVDYVDHPEYQGKLVGTSFFRNIEQCARDMGFRFVTGDHYGPREYRFFTKKLGWTPLSSLRPSFWSEIGGSKSDIHLRFNTTTVSFLNDEEREDFLKPDSCRDELLSYFSTVK